jgi:hypothetical protein
MADSYGNQPQVCFILPSASFQKLSLAIGETSLKIAYTMPVNHNSAVHTMQPKGENMNLLKNIFQRLALNDDGIEQCQSVVSPDSSKPNTQRAAPANSKSGELTQDQLAEVFHWLSLY